MAQQFDRLTGNTAADLIKWLQQFPSDTLVNVVEPTNVDEYYLSTQYVFIDQYNVDINFIDNQIYLGTS